MGWVIRSSIPGRGNIFFLSLNVYTGLGSIQALSLRYKAAGGVKVTTDLPAPRLRMSGAVRIISQRALMACIKNKFIFTFVDGSEGSTAPPSSFVLEEMF